MSTMATANNGNTTVPISNWKPNTDIIHAVAVVPIFAPMITEIACASERRPALTKLTVSTVVAVEDCTAAVTNAPVSSPVKRLVVIAPRTLRKWPPVSFWSASLIVFIPYIRRARHPRSFRKVKIVIGLMFKIVCKNNQSARIHKHFHHFRITFSSLSTRNPHSQRLMPHLAPAACH